MRPTTRLIATVLLYLVPYAVAALAGWAVIVLHGWLHGSGA